jgi:hypothetical protein
MKHIQTFEGFLNEARVKKPKLEEYWFLAELLPEDHDEAIAELNAAGIAYYFKDDHSKKRGWITVDISLLSPDQIKILDKWSEEAKISRNKGQAERKNMESENPKDIEKLIMQLPDTTEYIDIPDRPGDFVGSEKFYPSRDRNWKRNAIKHMYDSLKGDAGKAVYNIEFRSHTGGGIRGYSSWYLIYRTESSDRFGKDMAAGKYGRLD